MNIILIQQIALVICFVWSFLTLIGFLKGKAFNPMGKFNKFDHDASIKAFKRTTIATFDSDQLWFVPFGYSRSSFWIATIFNIFFIILFLLFGLGYIYFK